MIDREKVFDGLKCLADGDACCHSDCHYFDDRVTTSCFQRMAQDALELLKEQEAVEPILKREGRNKYYNYYVCPRCNEEVVYDQNYCPECGAKFMWEGR